MGYTINSTWTRLRQKDIEKLNKIIDDEYCIELEIGRKLNLMKQFDKALNEALENFNFKVVNEFMVAHNWEWAMYKDGKQYYKVPSWDEMKDAIKNDMYKHALYNILELKETHETISSGGLVLDMGIEGNDVWVQIYFDIATFCFDD